MGRLGKRKINHRVWIAVLAIVALAYTFRLEQTHHANAYQLSNTPPPGSIPVSSQEVPTSVENQVVSRLGMVLGKSDDVALFSLGNHQVGAYVTVDLGYTTSELTSADSQIVTEDINRWFHSVYAKPLEPVMADAEIFFFLNGRAVAGAGLGEQAYNRLATVVSSGTQPGFVHALGMVKQDANEGTNEAWVQLQP